MSADDRPARFGQDNAGPSAGDYSASLTSEKAIETTKIYSVVGMLAKGQDLVTQRPFRSPHHTISEPPSWPKPSNTATWIGAKGFSDEQCSIKGELHLYIEKLGNRMYGCA